MGAGPAAPPGRAGDHHELWKRHLLGLVTQVAKSWRGGNGLLLAATALMFVSGTVKYAERTWALKSTTADTMKGGRNADLFRTVTSKHHHNTLPSAVERYTHQIVGRKWWLHDKYSDLAEEAGHSFHNCINTLVDIPVATWLNPQIWGKIHEITAHRATMREVGPEDSRFPSMAYKMVEIQLSLIYDHIYTKVGLRYVQGRPLVGLGLPLLTLASTSSALALFAAARKQGHSDVDVAISYVLLAGAGGALRAELHAVLPVLLLPVAIFWLIQLVRPYRKPLWSNKWAQYNLLDGCIKERQAGLLFGLSRLAGGHTKLRPISDKSKELICNELDDESRLSRFGHVRGEGILSDMGHRDLQKSITDMDFSSSLVMWHLATDVCFLHAPEDGRHHMLLSRELSCYLMHLVQQRRVLISSEGHVAHRKARDEIMEILERHKDADGGPEAVKNMLEAGLDRDALPPGDAMRGRLPCQ